MVYTPLIVFASPLRKLAVGLAGVLLLTIAAFIAGCGSYASESTPGVDTSPLTTPTGAVGIVNDQFVRDTIVRKFGQDGLHGTPMVRDVIVTPRSDGLFVDIYVSRQTKCVGSNCNGDNPARVMQETTDMTKSLMSTLFVYPDVGRVQINVFGSTDNPGDENNPATRVMVTRATDAGIDWASVTSENLRSKVDEFWAAST